MSETASFDPTSASSVTASSIALLGISCMFGASYALGKNAADKNGSGFRAGMVIVASGILSFLIGMYIWFMYD